MTSNYPNSACYTPFILQSINNNDVYLQNNNKIMCLPGGSGYYETQLIQLDCNYQQNQNNDSNSNDNTNNSTYTLIFVTYVLL